MPPKYPKVRLLNTDIELVVGVYFLHYRTLILDVYPLMLIYCKTSTVGAVSHVCDVRVRREAAITYGSTINIIINHA